VLFIDEEHKLFINSIVLLCGNFRRVIMKKYFYSTIALLLFVIFMSGCSSSTEPSNTGSINLTSKYQTTVLAKDAMIAGIDSIKITKVTYLLREIKFKTQQDSTDSMFKSTPLILELNLTGAVQNIQGITVPFGTYNRLEFDIHKAEAADTTSMSADQKIKARQFFSGVNRYSIIIEGKKYTGGVATDFVYKSSINVKQKIDLPTSLVVNATNTDFNVTMLISSFGWFRNGNNLLDPLLSNDFTSIDNNLRASVRAYKDNNKDGVAD
jgi:hypothetical protein